MADHSKDVEEQRAQIREKLPEDPEAEEEQAVDDASLAPPGHLGERMQESERRT